MGNSTRAMIACLAMGWSTAVAANPTELCSDRPEATSPQSFPSDVDLLTAADRIEERVQVTRSMGGVVTSSQELTAVNLTVRSKPSPAALARYCYAAGELSLIAEEASQGQARNFLLAALEYSGRAGLPALTGKIAYRLGLNSTGGIPLRAVRGAGGMRRAQAKLAAKLRTATSAANGAAPSCAMLDTAAETSDG